MQQFLPVRKSDPKGLGAGTMIVKTTSQGVLQYENWIKVVACGRVKCLVTKMGSIIPSNTYQKKSIPKHYESNLKFALLQP